MSNFKIAMLALLYFCFLVTAEGVVMNLVMISAGLAAAYWVLTVKIEIYLHNLRSQIEREEHNA